MRRAAVRRGSLLAALTVLVVAAYVRAQDGERDAGVSPEPSSRRVVIGASGDVLFHTRVVEAADARGFDPLFGGLRGVIGPREIAFANLETPLSLQREPTRGDPPVLGAPPEAAWAMARVGLDVLSVANNHAWDQHHTGLAHTLAELSQAGIAPVGAAAEEGDAPGPVVIGRDGVRVAFVAFTVVIQGWAGTRRPDVRVALWDERRARRVLRRARERADIVVASMHWGIAYHHDHRSEQRDRAEFLVEHGADVVLGHGPHVLQRVERLESPRGEALVAYSLGNLISNQGYHFRRGRRFRGVEVPLREPATRDGVWLRVPVDLDSSGQVHIGDVAAVPLWTRNNWWDERRRRASQPDVRIGPLRTVPDAELVQERRRAIGRALGDAVHVLD